MSILNFFYPVLDALSDGRVVRKIVVWVLRILAALCLLGGLYVLVEILRFSFQVPAAEATIGGLLLGLIFIAAVVCVAQILWYRSDKVEGLTDTIFPVIPIVSILLRAVGEIYATLGVTVGVGGCLFVWFTKTSPYHLLREFGGLLPTVSAGESFLDGLRFLATLCVASFLFLVLFYFLAESTLLWVDVAYNMRLLRQHFVPTPQPVAVVRPAPAPPAYQPPAPPPAPAFQAPPPPPPPPPPGPAFQAPPPPSPPPAPPAYQPPPPPPTPAFQAPPVPPPPAPRCPACGADLEPGSAFCGNCGARLR